MNGKKPVIIQLSSDEEDRHLEETEQNRKNSSGFEIIDYEADYEVEASSLIETSRGCIVISAEKGDKIEPLKSQEWKDYFSNRASKEACILEFSRAVMTVIKGLDQASTVQFWKWGCPYAIKEEAQANFQSKYDQEIRESLDKLEKKYLQLGYNPAQLARVSKYCLQLLNNYCVDDPEVGFSRGMEYLAFAIISSLPEQALFPNNLLSYMCHIMRKLQFRGFFLPSKPSIFSKTKKLQEIMAKQQPQLLKKMDALKLDPSNVFFKYYLSLFLYSNQHRVLVKRLIQLLILEGEDFVTFLILRLMEQTKSQLLKLTGQKLANHLRNDLLRSYFEGASEIAAIKMLQNLVLHRIQCD